MVFRWTGDEYVDIEFILRFDNLQRLAHDHACCLAAKVFGQGTIVDADVPFAVFQIDSGY